MNRRLVVLVVSALALACASNTTQGATRPRGEPARYSGHEVGPTPVGAIPDVIVRDNDRNKDVQVTIEYPTRGGPHPLIVVTPGFGGTHRGYVGLSSYWAGNNYVVIRLNHNDRTANVEKPEDVWANATPADWRNRVRDVTFILDSLESLAQRFPELQGKIDATKIGVAGHSYGAHTAMLAAGVRTFPGGVSYADPRIKAIVVMSPQGPSDQRGLTSESWTELKVPTMFMTGSLDRGALESETPEWRAEGFRLSPAGDKWLVNLMGAGLVTFSGGVAGIEQIARERGVRDVNIPMAPDPRDPNVPRRPPSAGEVTREGPGTPRGSRAEALALQQKDVFATIRGVALTFFDAYLRGDAAGREALEKASARTGVVVEKK